ncbi:MAG: ABC transporter ATP-binding protein [Deltaproteobacteria bacterium]|nr:ABC transporter ATP-binding protein [Deltaproteobacteria bacterium]
MIDVELRRITKRFGDFTAVNDISLGVEKGEFLSLLGPSGCGKTTTLRIIAGFEEPSKGSVFIKGRCVDDVPPYQRNIGMVFQNYALFPHKTVFGNIAYGLRMRNIEKREIRRRVGEILEMVKLSGFEDRKPHQLSGGQQQRVALARALVIRPDVLLLDEPLSNLDAKLREEMRVETKRIQQSVGITTLYVTHDQVEALSMSDRVAIMEQGSIVQMGTPRDVYEIPASPFVADFMGQSNHLDGEIASTRDRESEIRTESGLRIVAKLTEGLQEKRRVRLFVRVETVELSLEPFPERENVFAGRVESISYHGSSTLYYVRLDERTRLVVEKPRHDAQNMKIQEDSRVWIRIPPQECITLPLG